MDKKGCTVFIGRYHSKTIIGECVFQADSYFLKIYKISLFPSWKKAFNVVMSERDNLFIQI
jgi:hypothetical protein